MAAAQTYEPIASTTLGSAAASITFSSVSSAYTDLRLVFVGTESTTGLNYANLRFNSDTGSNYSFTYITGSGTAAASATNSSTTLIRLNEWGLSSTIPSMVTVDIFSYAGSTYKTTLSTCAEDYNGSGMIESKIGLWRNTAAITTITLVNTASNFAIGTRATLYGIKAA